jgi:tetratricopeptide (TPR) repeat protein
VAALDAYQRSLAVAQEIGDLTRQEQAIGNLGLVEQLRGQWQVAEAYYRQALQLCEELGDQTGPAVWLMNLGTVLGLQGRDVEALPFFEQALAIARRTDDRSRQGTALLNIGNVLRNLGQMNEAEPRYAESLSLARELSNIHLEARALSCLGTLREMQERREEAGELFVQALDKYTHCSDAYGQVEVGYKLASWHHSHSHRAEAKAAAERAFELAQKQGLVPWEIRLLWFLGDLALEAEDAHGINLYAYAAVRARDINDERRLARCLSRIESIIQSATSREQWAIAEEAKSRAIAVWQDPDWSAMMADLIERFRQLSVSQ